MSFIPRVKVFDSTGLNLLYTFIAVQEANYPHSEKKYVEIQGLRGKGSIIIDGGDAPWDLTISGRLYADNYQALIVLIDAMETAIVLNTKYVVKIGKTSVTNYEYQVKRVTPIVWGETNFRNNYIHYSVTFRTNSW